MHKNKRFCNEVTSNVIKVNNSEILFKNEKKFLQAKVFSKYKQVDFLNQQILT